MADITMCQEHACILSKMCWRHEAPVSERQSWAQFDGAFHAGDSCSGFMVRGSAKGGDRMVRKPGGKPKPC